MGQDGGNSQSVTGTPTAVLLQIGSFGPDVLALQVNLNALSYGPLAEDSAFGPAVQAAVLKFQAATGLSPDGIVGSLTQSMIATKLAGKPSDSPAPAPAPQPASTFWTPGLDLSSYQPNTNWALVAGAGYKFAFIKATEGITIIDSQFAKNWAGTKANGILRGAYHFFRPELDPVAQAELLCRTVPNDWDLPHVLDLEVVDGVASSTIISRTQTFLDTVQSLIGRMPIVYTGLGFMAQIGNPAQFEKYPLWCAQYGPSAPSRVPPWASGEWKFWQYSGSHAVPGVPGACDGDWFNGTLDQLKAFAEPR